MCILLFGACLYFFVELSPIIHGIVVRYQRFIGERLKLCGQTGLRSQHFCGIQMLTGSGMGYLVTCVVGPSLGSIVAIVGSAIPLLILYSSILRRRSIFATQVVGALTLWSSAMSAGFSVLQGIELVSGEISAPLGYEFRRMVTEVKLGLSVEEALHNLNERMPNDDMSMISTAVAIQMETGGNLSEILGRVCESIRERTKIEGQLRTATAQGKLTGVVIVLIPFGLYLVMSILEPGFFVPMFSTSLGKIMLCVSATLEVIGILTMIRICKVEV